MANEVRFRAYTQDDASGSFRKIRVSADELAGSKSITTGFGLGMGAEIGRRGLDMIQSAFSDLIGGSVEAASSLNENLSKVRVVFGNTSASIEAFAKTAAKNLGLTESAALGAAGTFGNLFDSMGIGEKATTDMSIGILKLASDLASFNNLDPGEVLEKLRSGLVGEAEPLRSLGVNLNQASIEAKAMALGLWDGKGAIDAAAKAQASYALIMEQTGNAQGDFARTADGLANQQRILNAEIGNLQAKIGAMLLPAIKTLVSFVAGPGIDTLNELIDKPSKLIPIVGAAAAVIAGPMVSALKAMGKAAYSALGPLGLIIIGLTTVVETMNAGQTSPIIVETLNAVKKAIKDSPEAADALRQKLLAMLNDPSYKRSEIDQALLDDVELMKTLGITTDQQSTDIQAALGKVSKALGDVSDSAANLADVGGALKRMDTAMAVASTAATDLGGVWKTATKQIPKDVDKAMSDVASEIRTHRSAIVSAMKTTINETYDPLIVAAEITATKLELADLRKQRSAKNLTAAEKAELDLQILNAQKHYEELLADQTQYGSDAQRLSYLNGELANKGLIAGMNSQDEATRLAALSATGTILTEFDKLGGKLDASGAAAMKAYVAGMQRVLAQVVAAVVKLLDILASLLIAHSPPGPASPLHEIDKWGANTMDAYAKGILSRGSKIKRAISSVLTGASAGGVSVGLGMTPATAGGATVNFTYAPVIGTASTADLERAGRVLGPVIRDALRQSARGTSAI